MMASWNEMGEPFSKLDNVCGWSMTTPAVLPHAQSRRTKPPAGAPLPAEDLSPHKNPGQQTDHNAGVSKKPAI